MLILFLKFDLLTVSKYITNYRIGTPVSADCCQYAALVLNHTAFFNTVAKCSLCQSVKKDIFFRRVVKSLLTKTPLKKAV